ncbi:MAG: hypothetical protein GF347_04335 [Candidatus Moranbacteria bacterium]|nr:hypothetical protein [Candidatus Moranbacteria bacterium]
MFKNRLVAPLLILMFSIFSFVFGIFLAFSFAFGESRERSLRFLNKPDANGFYENKRYGNQSDFEEKKQAFEEQRRQIEKERLEEAERRKRALNLENRKPEFKKNVGSPKETNTLTYVENIFKKLQKRNGVNTERYKDHIINRLNE